MAKITALEAKATIVADDEFVINDSEVAVPTTTESTKTVKKSIVSTQVQADLATADTYMAKNPDVIEMDDCNASGVISTAKGYRTEASGHYSHAEGVSTTAEGMGAHAEGYKTKASGNYSHAEGRYSETRLLNQYAHSSSELGNVGDAQYTRNILMKQTTDATPTACAKGLTEKYFIKTNGIFACTITVNGTNSDGTVAGFYKRQAYIKNIGGTTALIGAIQTIGTDIETGSIGGIAITADNANDCLDITVTGKAATTIKWVAIVQAAEVGFY